MPFFMCLGFWEVPSTASLHSGVHPGSQWAEWWDGGRQEVHPQVRNCQACVKMSIAFLDLYRCWTFSSDCMVSNPSLSVFQHARANRAVPSPTCPAKPGGGVSRCYLFLLWGVHQQVSLSHTHLILPLFSPLPQPTHPDILLIWLLQFEQLRSVGPEGQKHGKLDKLQLPWGSMLPYCFYTKWLPECTFQHLMTTYAHFMKVQCSVLESCWFSVKVILQAVVCATVNSSVHKGRIY